MVTEDKTLYTPEDDFYQMCHVSARLRTELNRVMRPLAEEWIGGVDRLQPAAIYGFRRYLRNGWMPIHVDRKGV